MRIVIVNPLWTLQNVLASNLAELAAYVRANGYPDVEIVDLNYELRSVAAGESFIDAAVERLERSRPDVIALTCATVHLPFCREFIQAWKRRNRVPVVVGGIHPTFRPESLLGAELADYVVRGEGELTFLELVRALESDRDVADVAGLSFLRGGEVRSNPDRGLIPDLSALPFPAYDLLGRYVATDRNKLSCVPITASRGCPCQCVFCSSSRMWRNQRRKPVQRVIAEIEALVGLCGRRNVMFWDDNLTLRPSWLAELMCALTPLHIKWHCLARADLLQRGMLESMKAAGCRGLYHGIESGSARIRALLGKRVRSTFDNDALLRMIDTEVELGLTPTCSLMCATPTETKPEFEETVELCTRLRDRGAIVQLWMLTPYPDTEAAQRFGDSIVKFDRYRNLRQSDIFQWDQVFLYGSYYRDYDSENPDCHMFSSAMPVEEFCEKYRDARRRVWGVQTSDQPLVLCLEQGASATCLLEPTSGGLVRTLVQEVTIRQPINRLAVPEPDGSNVLLVRIESRTAEWPAHEWNRILGFLARCRKRFSTVRLTRPLPSGAGRSPLLGLIGLPKPPAGCRDCLDLFRIVPGGGVVLCSGHQLGDKADFSCREQVYEFSKRIRLWHQGRNQSQCFANPDRSPQTNT